jgi:hypothetical protein
MAESEYLKESDATRTRWAHRGEGAVRAASLGMCYNLRCLPAAKRAKLPDQPVWGGLSEADNRAYRLAQGKAWKIVRRNRANGWSSSRPRKAGRAERHECGGEELCYSTIRTYCRAPQSQRVNDQQTAAGAWYNQWSEQEWALWWEQAGAAAREAARAQRAYQRQRRQNTTGFPCMDGGRAVAAAPKPKPRHAKKPKQPAPKLKAARSAEEAAAALCCSFEVQQAADATAAARVRQGAAALCAQAGQTARRFFNSRARIHPRLTVGALQSPQAAGTAWAVAAGAKPRVDVTLELSCSRRCSDSAALRVQLAELLQRAVTAAAAGGGA